MGNMLSGLIMLHLHGMSRPGNHNLYLQFGRLSAAEADSLFTAFWAVLTNWVKSVPDMAAASAGNAAPPLTCGRTIPELWGANFPILLTVPKDLFDREDFQDDIIIDDFTDELDAAFSAGTAGGKKRTAQDDSELVALYKAHKMARSNKSSATVANASPGGPTADNESAGASAGGAAASEPAATPSAPVPFSGSGRTLASSGTQQARDGTIMWSHRRDEKSS